MSDDLEIFTPAEAVKYLREKRGIIFTVASLRNRRRHKTAQASRVLPNNSLWTKADLDAIEPSKRTKRVDGNSSVMLVTSSKAA